jgi:hypothetical protein
MPISHQGDLDLIIPPNSKDFTIAVHIAPDCTENFNTDGITVFSVQFHAHEAGIINLIIVSKKPNKLDT